MSHTYFANNNPIEGLGMALEIKAIDDVLQKNKHCNLPDDYVDFLHETNGMLTNSFSLFGTRPQALAQGEQEDDILDATFRAADDEIIDGSDIVLGRTSDGMLVTFSNNNQHYHIIESTTGESIYEYLTINGFIVDWSDFCPNTNMTPS